MVSNIARVQDHHCSRVSLCILNATRKSSTETKMEQKQMKKNKKETLTFSIWRSGCDFRQVWLRLLHKPATWNNRHKLKTKPVRKIFYFSNCHDVSEPVFANTGAIRFLSGSFWCQDCHLLKIHRVNALRSTSETSKVSPGSVCWMFQWFLWSGSLAVPCRTWW